MLTRRRQEPRWLPAVMGLVAVIVFADALIGDRSLSSEVRARTRYEAVGAEVTALRGQNARLRDEAERLREDPGTIEYVARKDLGLVRPGEIVVVMK